MSMSKKILMLALLCMASNTVWAEPVNFCKVKKVYDNDINVPVKIVYEDCSGVALLWYAKDLIKASCWEGATSLIEGKCEMHKDEYQAALPESPAIEVQEEKQP